MMLAIYGGSETSPNRSSERLCATLEPWFGGSMLHRGSGFGRFLLVIVLSLAMVLNGFPVQALAEIVEDTPVVQDGDAPDAGDEEVMSEADTGEGTVSEPSDSISTSSEELVDETLVLEEVAVTEIATQEFDASGEELAAAYMKTTTCRRFTIN